MIAEIEDAILALVDAKLPSKLRQTGSIPGGWTLKTLQNALQFAPGVYVAFLGGAQRPENETILDAQFYVYVVTGEPLEVDRRRGGALRSIGAYGIIELLAPALHGLSIPDAGTLSLGRVQNLYGDKLLDLGGTVYALPCSIPLPLPGLDIAALPDFLRCYADWDMSSPRNDPQTPTQPDGQIDAQDQIILPPTV
jgi:phage gp37-like protein